MPMLEHGDLRLHYELSGSGNGPVLALANALGSDLHIWDKALIPFEKSHRVLRYDMRGHGKSSVPPGAYTVEQLGGDLLLLLDHLDIERVNLCGLSLGGLVAIWVGIHAPERLNRLVLANTAARIGTRDGWEQRIAFVQSSGMDALALQSLERWFTAAYRQQHPEEMEAVRTTIAATDASGYAGCCAALRDTDLRAEVHSIEAPSLVIAGTHDPSTPPSVGRELQSKLRNSEYVQLDASHISAWERADEFAGAVLAFLEPVERVSERAVMDERERHEAGMRVRRSVLGDDHVNRAEGAKTYFDTEFQDLITRYAWGEIWTRAGLSRHTRSLLTIGLMIALNRNDELRMHLRAAANNGVTAEEIREVLLHCAIYCGVPAANAAFHIAKEVSDHGENAT